MSPHGTERLRLLVDTLRAPFFSVSALSFLLGTAFVFWRLGAIDWAAALIGLAAVVAMHGGANTANDYYDHISGNDWAAPKRSPFSGGSRVIQRGLVTARGVLAISIVSFLIGGTLGVILAIRTGSWAIIALGIAGAAAGWLYTAPPGRLGYRGFGELTIALTFGPAVTLGAHLIQTGRFSWESVLVGIPPGILIGMVLFVNEFTDIRMDAAAGKRTLVVILGPRVAAMLYAVFGTACSAAIAALWLGGLLPPLALAALAVTPAYYLIARQLLSTDTEALIRASAGHLRINHLTVAWLALALFLSRH